MAERLHGLARGAAIRQLADWSEVEDRDAIRKTYHFGSFREGWGFMSEAALLAENMDHHPEWFNVGNRVEIILTARSVEGLTDLDIALAHTIDEIAPERDHRRRAH